MAKASGSAGSLRVRPQWLPCGSPGCQCSVALSVVHHFLSASKPFRKAKWRCWWGPNIEGRLGNKINHRLSSHHQYALLLFLGKLTQIIFLKRKKCPRWVCVCMHTHTQCQFLIFILFYLKTAFDTLHQNFLFETFFLWFPRNQTYLIVFLSLWLSLQVFFAVSLLPPPSPNTCEWLRECPWFSSLLHLFHPCPRPPLVLSSKAFDLISMLSASKFPSPAHTSP